MPSIVDTDKRAVANILCHFDVPYELAWWPAPTESVLADIEELRNRKGGFTLKARGAQTATCTPGSGIVSAHYPYIVLFPQGIG